MKRTIRWGVWLFLSTLLAQAGEERIALRCVTVLKCCWDSRGPTETRGWDETKSSRLEWDYWKWLENQWSSSESCGAPWISWGRLYKFSEDKLSWDSSSECFLQDPSYPCKKMCLCLNSENFSEATPHWFHRESFPWGNKRPEAQKAWRFSSHIHQELIPSATQRHPRCWPSPPLWETWACEMQVARVWFWSRIKYQQDKGFNWFEFLCLEMHSYPTVYVDTVYIDSKAL